MAKKKNYENEDGVWRTVGGRRVFIRTGASLSEAMKESGKFRKSKSLKDVNEEYDKKIESQRELTKILDGERKLATRKYGELDNETELYKKGYEEAVGKLHQLRAEKEIEVGKTIKNIKNVDLPNEYGIDVKEEQVNRLRKVGNSKSEYELYKRAKENPDSIDPMTENSTDWESLEEKYGKRYNNEQLEKEGRKVKREYNKKLREEDRISKGMTEEEYKQGKYVFEREKEDYEDILNRYSEDYGYEGKDRLSNLKGQIDYMRNPGESINQTAQRLVSGGDFLIYNGDVQDYLKQRGIKFNEDNFFDKYKTDMAGKIEKLYNQADLKDRYSGTVSYLQKTTNMSSSEILELLKKIDEDKK